MGLQLWTVFVTRTYLILKVFVVTILLRDMVIVATEASRNESSRRQNSTVVDFDSLHIFPKLNFTSSWTVHTKHFWKSEEFNFESRYEQKLSRNANGSTPVTHVQVYLLPYSHNDPGWLQTFEEYFYSKTKRILNHAVTQMVRHENITFAWSEISYLSKWWDEASSSQKEVLGGLVSQGRFEILTGGWVMPDEGTTTLLGLVTQLIEGHQWIKMNLNATPTSAWSIDPFGHGSTMPYLLRKADITGMMIQRIHYAWKHWLAEGRNSDFLWAPRWSSNPKDAILCHNAHYDLYPTKHSCGPSPHTCMKFDFRKVGDRPEEHWKHMTPATDHNLADLAEALVGQYRRTASLTRHNIVMTSLGGDFRWEESSEWDQQRANYEKLYNHINSHQQTYHTTTQFGTISRYFQAINETNMTFPTFRGDFFPYGDILFAFAPAYWTGYFGTRPYWKRLCRETEDELLKAEILFTFSYNLNMQRNLPTLKLSRIYDNLVHVRRLVALFQHHDGITGTSPRRTMLDYARKLTKAWNFSKQIQRAGIEEIWRNQLDINIPPISNEVARQGYHRLPVQTVASLYENASVVKKLVIFNSVGWKRSQLIRLTVETPYVAVKGSNGEDIISQIQPKFSQNGTLHHLQDGLYELLFVAVLPPLSIVTFEVHQDDGGRNAVVNAEVTCKNCNHATPIEGKQIIMENGQIVACFDTDYGLLRRMKRKPGNTEANISLTWGRYESTLGSGAYLLRPYTSFIHPALDGKNSTQLYLFDGPVASELVLISGRIKVSTWVIKFGLVETQSVLFMSTTVLGNTTDKGEFFMRFQTDLNSTQTTSSLKPHPIFYTDTNGLAVEKRATLSKLPYGANNYPLTNFGFLQDEQRKLRFSILVDRTHGMSSMAAGRLEMIFDRRLQFDDGRGMNEGVEDKEDVVSSYGLVLEALPDYCNKSVGTGMGGMPQVWEPSLAVQRASKYLNHPPAVFLYDALAGDANGRISLFTNDFPDDAFLLNLRTLSSHGTGIKSVPSSTSLMIIQRLGHQHQADVTAAGGTQHSNELIRDTTNANNNSLNVLTLNATMNMRHSIRLTNLVGTKEFSSNASFMFNNNTKHLHVGSLYELSAFLIDF